jgi:hypothetical protein
VRAAAFALLSALSLASCRAKKAAPIQVVTGPAAEDRIEFLPQAAFAEYFELEDLRNELRITLTSYQASCDEFAAPKAGQVSVVVSVVSPAGTALGDGTYVWGGHAAHGGTAAKPEKPFAAPTVRIGGRGLALPPGGALELKSVSKAMDAPIRGYLAFEFPGDAEQPATSLRGNFEAKLCRVSVP